MTGSPERERAEALGRLKEKATPGSFSVAGARYVLALEAAVSRLVERAEKAERERDEHVCDEAGFEHGHDLARRRYEPRLVEAESRLAAARRARAVLSTGVGLARLRLLDGDARGAAEALDHAAEKSTRLFNEAVCALTTETAEQSNQEVVPAETAYPASIHAVGGFTTGHGGTSDQRTFSSDPYPAAPEVLPEETR